MNGSRNSLILLEFLIALFVMTVSCAVCLGLFAAAGGKTETAGLLSEAIFQADTVAETIQSCGGDLNAAAEMLGGEMTENGFTVVYEDAVCDVFLSDSDDLFVYPDITVSDNDGDVLCHITATALKGGIIP